MRYAALTDLAQAMPPDVLTRLASDDPMATAPDAPIVDAALAHADARIDAARVPRGMLMPVRRLRAGYTFTRNPVEIEVSPETAELIESDPILAVERIDGGGA